jgi:hypothetical protein
MISLKFKTGLPHHETALLSLGMFLIFLGMLLLKLNDKVLSHGSFEPLIMGLSLIFVIAGVFKITETMSRMSDAFLFTFFRNVESIRLFMIDGGIYSLLASVGVAFVSMLGYLLSEQIEASALGALAFSVLFPMIVLLFRRRKRVMIYRKLSEDVDENGV